MGMNSPIVVGRLATVTLAFASIVAVGCGETSTTLTGAATYNGAPVESGTITFTPSASGTPFGGKIVDGKYAVEKATAGKYTVIVRADRNNEGPLTREQAAQPSSSSPPNYIPEDAAGNSQTVDVTGGAQTLDFALTGPPRK